MDLSSLFSAANVALFGPLLRALQQHEWVPAIAIVSSYVVMLLDQDSRFPVSLPANWNDNRWKPAAVLVAANVQAAIVALGTGMPPWQVVALGFQSTLFSYGLWALVVKAIYGGNVPKWLLWVSMALPKPKEFDPAKGVTLKVPPTQVIPIQPAPIPDLSSPPDPPKVA